MAKNESSANLETNQLIQKDLLEDDEDVAAAMISIVPIIVDL